MSFYLVVALTVLNHIAYKGSKMLVSLYAIDFGATPFQVGVADFSGIGHTDGPLFIGDVFHKAMVGLDEKGVEAAAATAVVMNAGTAAPTDPPKQVHADRPFFFAIVDEPTSSVLFAGHVADPTAK